MSSQPGEAEGGAGDDAEPPERHAEVSLMELSQVSASTVTDCHFLFALRNTFKGEYRKKECRDSLPTCQQSADTPAAGKTSFHSSFSFCSFHPGRPRPERRSCWRLRSTSSCRRPAAPTPNRPRSPSAAAVKPSSSWAPATREPRPSSSTSTAWTTRSARLSLSNDSLDVDGGRSHERFVL